MGATYVICLKASIHGGRSDGQVPLLGKMTLRNSLNSSTFFCNYGLLLDNHYAIISLVNKGHIVSNRTRFQVMEWMFTNLKI